MHPITLSVVIMAYNEEDSLPVQLERTVAFLRGAVRDFEVLVVDDGSSDGTAAIVRRAAMREPRVRLLQHDRNYGMGRAIRTGYAAARLEYVTQLPADGQVDPVVLARFLPLLEHADLVLSVYDRRGDGPLRWVLSQGYRVLGRIVLGTRADYTGTMVFRRALLDRVTLESDTFFVNLEFPLRCLRMGVPHALVTFHPERRIAGRSKVTTARRIGHVAAEMLRMRWRELTASRPTPRP